MSFRDAVELLHNDSSQTFSLAADVHAPIKKTTVPLLETPVSTDAEDQTLLRQVIDYCHTTLKQAPSHRGLLIVSHTHRGQVFDL